MLLKPLSEKVKDLAIQSDIKNLKILSALSYLKHIGKKDCRDKELLKIVAIPKDDMIKYCRILEETGCLSVQIRNIKGESLYEFYRITKYGEKILNDVGINKNVIEAMIKRQSP